MQDRIKALRERMEQQIGQVEARRNWLLSGRTFSARRARWLI